MLSGTVPDAPSLSKAIEITEQFTAGCAGVAPAQSQQPQAPAQPVGPGEAGVGPASAPGVGNPVAALMQVLAPPAPAPVKCYSNALSVRATQQVMVEVRFVEAQRTAARNLGFSWDVHSKRFGGLTGQPLQGVPVISTVANAIPLIATPGLANGGIPFGSFITRVLDGGTQADLLISALEKQGLARRLAEPNLVTMSGDTANFLAGGEFPFPVQADDRRITLQFKKFGVGLAFTPTVLGDGQINLKIEPEVSDLDQNNAFTLVNGITVPSLIVRRASTTVELRDGQSFAIAGLLQTKHIKNHNQLPWLGDVPVLGAFLRSASYEKEESDLVIIVTPRLVQPAVPGQKLATPFDQRLASNDAEFFLRGKHEIPKHFPSPHGHILEISQTWSSRTIKEQEVHK